MANYFHPGVYPEIVDLSQIVQASSTSIGGAVGAAERGSINQRMLMSSTSAYTTEFGNRDLKYGYMGHCMTAAFEEMRSAYVVRVPAKDAKYSAVKIYPETAIAGSAPINAGFSLNEYEAADFFVAYKVVDKSSNNKYTRVVGSIDEAVEAGTLLFDTADCTGVATIATADTYTYTVGDVAGSAMVSDASSLMLITAENPNVIDLRVSIEESTPAPSTSPATSAAGTIATNTVIVTKAKHGLEVNDFVFVNGASDPTYNGKWRVTARTEDTFTYAVTGTLTTTTPTGLRFAKYPDNDQRTFTLKVYEVIDGVLTLLETYNDVTMYQGKDGFGNQTYVQDVVNNSSRQIRVYVNDAVAETESGYAFPAELPDAALKGGSLGGAISSSDISDGWDLFSNRDEVRVNLLINCGYVGANDIIVQSKMLSIAKSRRDCFCIFDMPYDCTEAAPKTTAIDWRKDIQAVDSYYAALYTPWVKVYDTIVDRANVALPPSGFIAQVIARRDRRKAPWFAPAGMNDGVIVSSELTPTGLTETYDEAAQDALYSNGINYLLRIPGTGFVVWGQKTEQTKASALDRINVARLVIYIESSLRDAARYHLFENNTAFLRQQITQQFSDFLEDIRVRGGVYAYSVVCNDTNNTATVIDNNQLNIDIYIQPVKTAEFIRLQTVITRTNADISVLVSTGGNF